MAVDYSLRGKCEPMNVEEFVRLLTTHRNFCYENSNCGGIGPIHNRVTVGVYYSSYFTKGNIIFITLPLIDCTSIMRGAYGVEEFTIMEKTDIDKFARELYTRLAKHFGKKEAWK